MSKFLALVVLAAAALPSAADYRRFEYGGYRIGNSDVMTDQDRIHILPVRVEEESSRPEEMSKEITADKADGQKIVKWWAYQSKRMVPATHTTPSYMQYTNSQDIAGADYSMSLKYDTVGYSPAYVVVDYDWVKYNLSYDRNGGSGTLPASTNNVVYTNSLVMADNTLSRTGYTWSGWTNDLATTVWTGGETVTGESLGLKSNVDGSNIVMRADWTPNTYRVTLDADGGIVSPASVDVTYDAPWPLLQTPTKDGYYFDGWFNDKACTIATPTDSTVSITNDTTIYAKWTRRLVATFFDPKDSRRETVDVRYGEKPVPPFTPYHKSYIFREWIPALDAIVRDTVFTAQFIGAQYFITYHSNFGATEETVDIDYVYGTAKAAPDGAIEFPRTGYAFLGWATNAASSEVRFRAGDDIDTFSDEGDALYAVWAPVECVIHFDANGGIGEMSDAAARYDEVYTIPDCDFTKPGVAFLGWATNATGGVVFKPGDSIANVTSKPGTAFTLYAVWAETKYIAFDGNGANDLNAMAKDTMTLERNETKALVANKFEKTGYTFGGWATNMVAATNFVATYADRAAVACEDLWMPIGETNVLYAVWKANTYTVVFKPNGAGGELKYQQFVYDQPQMLDTEMLKTYYTQPSFMGWATNLTADVVYSKGVDNILINLTAEANGIFELYAVWDNGKLSKAMHCDNLVWGTQENPQIGTVSWHVAEGSGEGCRDATTKTPSGSSLISTVPGDVDQQKDATTHNLIPPETFDGSGWLSFLYKMSSQDECKLILRADFGNGDIETTNINPSVDWQLFGPVEINALNSVKIYFTHNLESTSEDSYTVWIDQMKWEPMTKVNLPNEGWSKVSFDSLPVDASPSNVFAEKKDSIDCVVQGGMTWSPKTGGRLTSLAAGIEYWVHTTTSDVSWPVNGATAPDLEDDVYGPFGRFANIDGETQKLTPTVYSDVSLTFGGNDAQTNDCIAAYYDGNKLCGLGKAYKSGPSVKCDLVLYAGAGTNVHFRAWRSSTPATADSIVDVDSTCDIVAPAPGTIALEEKALTVAARVFTVSFDGNGGTGTMEDQKFTEGEKQELKANAFKRDGYRFSGWKDYGGKDHEDGDSIVVESDLTLVAQWELIDVSCSPTSATYPWRATGDSPLAGSFSVTCNTGWTATAEESWITITSGASGNGNGTVNYSLSENYTKETRAGAITIAADGVGRTTTFAVSQEGREAAPILDIQNGVLVGVSMEGYADCEIPDTVTSIAAGAFKNNTEVYVVKIPASVANIGAGAFEGCANLTNVVFAGDAPAAGSGIFKGTPEGLVVFALRGMEGWPEDGAKWPSGDGDARKIELSKYFTVSFDWNGWTDGPKTNITVDAGESCELPLFDLFESDNASHRQNREGVRPGYVFGGWNTTGSADDAMVSFDAFVPESNVTLKARWIANTYVFKFDANGGKPESLKEFRQTIGAKWNVNGLVEPSLDKAEFAGWWTDKTDGVQVDVSGTYDIIANLESATILYAHWVKQDIPGYVAVEAQAEFEQDGASGTVTMNPNDDLLPTGTTVTLTAKPGKDTVFAYWLANGEKVGYTTTLKFAPEADTVFTAVFRLKSAVASPEFDEAAIEQSAAVVGVAYNASVPVVDAAYPAKFSAKRLPAGLKLDAVSGKIAGAPTKAGSYDVEITAKGGASGKSSSSIVLHIDVAELPAWAQGAFVGSVKCRVESVKLKEELGLATMTVGATGKISGKIALAGTNWTFKADSYSAVDIDTSSEVVSPKSFVVETVAKAGKATKALELRVESAGSVEGVLPNGVAEGGAVDGSVSLFACRNMWKDKATAAVAKATLAKFEGVYTVSIADGALASGEPSPEYGSGYLSLTVGKNGDVKATGKLADGTSASATSPLMYDEFAGWFVMLYAAPSAYKGGAFAAAVGFDTGAYRLLPVLFAPQWSSRNPQATGVYGEGFDREIALEGAYYDKLSALYAYYGSLRLSFDGGLGEAALPELGYVYKETYLNDSGRKTTYSESREADAVDTLWQAGLTATVNEKGAIVVAKATKPVQDKTTKEWSYSGANDGALTLSFAQATGIFKGSYTFWYDYVSAYDKTTGKKTLTHTSKKVSFEGILVQGEEPNEPIMDGFYLWDATGEYKDPKTGKPKTYKYKQSYTVTLEELP